MSVNLNRAALNADDIYEAIIDMHDDLNAVESAACNARLILILANHIGDLETIKTATRAAREAK